MWWGAISNVYDWNYAVSVIQPSSFVFFYFLLFFCECSRYYRKYLQLFLVFLLVLHNKNIKSLYEWRLVCVCNIRFSADHSVLKFPKFKYEKYKLLSWFCKRHRISLFFANSVSMMNVLNSNEFHSQTKNGRKRICWNGNCYVETAVWIFSSERNFVNLLAWYI